MNNMSRVSTPKKQDVGSNLFKGKYKEKASASIFKAPKAKALKPTFTAPKGIQPLIDNRQRKLDGVKSSNKKNNLNENNFTFLANRIISRLEAGWCPLSSNYFAKMLKDRTKPIYAERKALGRVCMKAMVMMADNITGILPYSCISTLSDQCGVSTYGQALYIDGLRVDNDPYAELRPDEMKRAKRKKSISRLSRFFKMLKSMGLIEIEYINDLVTKEQLPSIIRLTDSFYYTMGETKEKLQTARQQTIGWRKKNKEIEFDLHDYVDIVEAEKERQLIIVRQRREEYRRIKRIRTRMDKMDKIGRYEYAQRLVNAKYSFPERADMSVNDYENAVREELRAVYSFTKTSKTGFDKKPPQYH